MKTIQELRLEIEKITKRNKKVERDKQWETSCTRRIFIASITFLSAFSFLKIMNMEPAILGAFVPVGGFLLSQLSIKPLRKIWDKF